MNKDKRNRITLILIGLILVLITIGNNKLFGSDLDWRTQHYAIPEYFRTLFYSDFKLFPSFAFNLGAGQNIYNFSYYGLLSPIILISYLLPFVKMVTYIQTVSIIIFISTTVLFYKWIRGRFDENNSFYLSLLFMFSTPLLFHAHRHIMFVSYMPFLIMSLIGVDNIFNKKGSKLLIISTFLLIMTNYFFSVSSIIVIGIYAIYKIIEEKKKFTKEIFKVIIPVIISMLMAAVILVPTAYTLLSGRAETNVAIDMKRLLTPYIHGMYMLYTPYSSGLTSLIILTIICSFFKKIKEVRFLSYIFILILMFPIFVYILNGGMYLNAKVLIPFLPLVMLLTGKVFDNFFKNRKQIIVISLIYITLMIPTIISIIDVYEKYIYIDLSIFAIILATLFTTKSMKIFKIQTVILSLVALLFINATDNLVTKEELREINRLDQEISSYNMEDKSIYRFGDYINEFDNLNRVLNTEQYKTTMYSSVSNGYYNDFFFNIFSNEISYRNSAITAMSKNVMFNTYMGIKYIVSKNDMPYYKKVEGNLYVNENVLPLGYIRNKIMSEKTYDKLQFPYTNEALLNYTVVDSESESEYKTNIEKINLNYKVENISNVKIIEDKGNSFKLDASKNGKIVLKLNEPIKDKIIFIKFKMDYNESCDVGDNVITINGVKNNLTCSSWKYHNKNYNFEYVISETDDIEQLNISFNKGHYEVKDIEIYTLDDNKILDKSNISEMYFDKEKTNGDYIYGKTNVKEDGYLTLKIPYDKGFEIFVDGEKTEYKIVDKSFIGFKINKGNHEIKIKYTSPYLNVSKIISATGFLAFIGYIVIEKRSMTHEKNITSSTLLQ